jgi:uncharacterized protein
MNAVGTERQIFHDGERRVQERTGAVERTALRGQRMVRDYLPDEHREFFAALYHVFAATLDANGYPAANVFTGSRGLLTSPDCHHLALGRYDAAFATARLAAGDPIALLGLDFTSARRNRANGVIEAAGQDGLLVRIHQSFGNCPKYVHRRYHDIADAETVETDFRDVVEAAETFFIATRSSDLNVANGGGIDISHRGGQPGFVRWIDTKTILFFDYPGNNFFNTLGNIVTDPRASLLFVNFANGQTWAVRGIAELIWVDAQVPAQSLPNSPAHCAPTREIRVSIEAITTGQTLNDFRWPMVSAAGEVTCASHALPRGAI